MRPERSNIAAPELPGGVRWLGTDRLPKMAELTAAGPVLVHFFDFAQLNSVRALPYVIAWDERYRAAGLTTLGVHSPRFKFTAGRAELAAALARLGVPYPVADDSRYVIWHDYGCKGWPSLFLWGQGGALRWFHFGEGEYDGTERAIAEELRAVDSQFEPPAPLEALRPSDARDALVAPPTDEVVPGGSLTTPWRARADGDRIELDYEAGGSYASAAGVGQLRVVLDGGPPRAIEVAGGGLYELAQHPRHERHSLSLGADPEIEIYSLSFAAAPRSRSPKGEAEVRRR